MIEADVLKLCQCLKDEYYKAFHDNDNSAFKSIVSNVDSKEIKLDNDLDHEFLKNEYIMSYVLLGDRINTFEDIIENVKEDGRNLGKRAAQETFDLPVLKILNGSYDIQWAKIKTNVDKTISVESKIEFIEDYILNQIENMTSRIQRYKSPNEMNFYLVYPTNSFHKIKELSHIQMIPIDENLWKKAKIPENVFFIFEKESIKMWNDGGKFDLYSINNAGMLRSIFK